MLSLICFKTQLQEMCLFLKLTRPNENINLILIPLTYG